MISLSDRLWVGSGALTPGGPYTWHITDFDQRRHFSVTYDPPTPIPVKDEEETEDICLEKFRKHVDDLGEGIFGIRFSQPDRPITTSTGRKDDVTLYINYYPFTALELPFPAKTISLAKMTELDRLGPQVDKVSYQGMLCVGTASKATVAVFKYWFIHIGSMFRTWHELNNWIRLPHDH